MPESRIDLTMSLNDQISKGLGSIVGGLGKLATGFLAFETARRLFTGIADATIALDTQMARLEGAMSRAGINWKQAKPQIDAFTNGLEESKGVIDDFSRESLVRAIDYTKNLGAAMRITTAAADLAAAKDMDLVTATDLLGKAYLGKTEMLGRYGIVIDETTPKADKFQAVMEQVNRRFGGAAAAEADTYAKKLELMRDRFQDIGEAIGGDGHGAKVVLDDFNDALRVTALILKGEWSEAWKQMKKDTEDMLKQSAIDDLIIQGKALGGEYKRAAEQVTRTGMKWHELSTYAGEAATGVKELTDEMKAYNAAVTKEGERQLQAWMDKVAEIKKITASLRENIPESILIDESESDRAAEVFHDLEVTSNETTAEIKSDWRNAFNAIATGSKEKFGVMTTVAKATADGLAMAFSGASQSILGSWKWLNEETNGVLKKMAQDFVRYFVDSILASMANMLIPGILGFLGSLFDTPANDRMAAQQGKDFAHHFQRGMMERFAGAGPLIGDWAKWQNFGLMPALGKAPDLTVHPITIHVTGNVMTPEFVQNHLGPLIEKYSRGGSVNIQYENNFKTGSPVLAF